MLYRQTPHLWYSFKNTEKAWHFSFPSSQPLGWNWRQTGLSVFFSHLSLLLGGGSLCCATYSTDLNDNTEMAVTICLQADVEDNTARERNEAHRTSMGCCGATQQTPTPWEDFQLKTEEIQYKDWNRAGTGSGAHLRRQHILHMAIYTPINHHTPKDDSCKVLPLEPVPILSPSRSSPSHSRGE